MGDSYRLRTQVGINQTLTIQLDQDFEFLEILSLKIQQSDIYTRSCSDYGVLVGRVLANNGFGVPNAKVSVFIPLFPTDESNPIISSIYPYKSTQDVNEDGYRYNLLPYEKSYSTHAATGTFPSRLDGLTGSTAIEIFDKYYKYTAKTNDSGDYMIMGVPLGSQTIMMDLDLSDIGEFSLTPQDLIRMGLATESQVAGNQFRSSNDLNSLPQILTLTKNVEISPLWGDPSVCQIAINRLDFDLRDELNIDIQPTAVFMGSIYSSAESNRVKPGNSFFNLFDSQNDTKIASKLGNLCNLESGPGQIVAIRQTINQDEDGNPILEVYQIENSGNVIDGDGVWMIEIPMNLEYVVTNEFGERVVSRDATVGIPTKGKYRFKIKWRQPNNFSNQVKRGYFLVPNVREYGWDSAGNTDPNFNNNPTTFKQLQSSYYFGLDWTGYTQGFASNVLKQQKLDQIINCEDTFYEFNFNKVYTVSGLIDQFKRGGVSNFIGIKQIDDNECSSEINKFPVNEGFPNITGGFLLFTLGTTILALIMTAYITFVNLLLLPLGTILSIFDVQISIPFAKLPMLTYPDCTYCACDETSSTVPNPPPAAPPPGVLTQFGQPGFYFEGVRDYFYLNQNVTIGQDLNSYAEIVSDVLASNSPLGFSKNVPKSRELIFSDDSYSRFAYSTDLPLGERINMFNSRKSYFDGLNKIKVTFAENLNPTTFHYDNCLVVVSNVELTAGQMLSFINPNRTSDTNFLGQGVGYIYDQDGNPISEFQLSGTKTSGTTVFNGEIDVKYAETQLSEQTVKYFLDNGPNYTQVSWPADIEYYQVIYSNTVSEVMSFWDDTTPQSFPNLFTSVTNVVIAKSESANNISNYKFEKSIPLQAYKYFADIDNKYITVIQRGVDPYSPKYQNKYDLSNIFGLQDNELVVTVQSRLNIPVQKLPNTNLSVQEPSQDGMMYPSYFFQPQPFNPETYTGYLGFYTIPPIRYGRIDATYTNDGMLSIPLTDNMLSKVSRSNNVFWGFATSSSKYDSAEDISGVGFLYGNFALPGFNQSFTYSYINMSYYSPLYTGSFGISNPNKIVMRTDRLPSSEDENEFLNTNVNLYKLLQQNPFFRFFAFNDDDGTQTTITIPGTTTYNNIDPINIQGLPSSTNVLNSFSCENMVDLNCYEGFGESFGINENCAEKDRVENGCYLFLQEVGTVTGLARDISAINEWKFRLNIFYAICNNVISQSFTNNWVNGSLFMFPVQVNTVFSLGNEPVSKYPRNVTFYDPLTNNLYYRSSPYYFTLTTKKFVGKNSEPIVGNINKRNLMFPTTIIDLGYKSTIYSELTLLPETKSYLVDKLDSTSYGDTSDLINLFVVSRMADAGFLKQVGGGTLTVLFFFSRITSGFVDVLLNSRLDGDITQLLSINSEIGNIKFTPEFYVYDNTSTNNPVIITGTENSPVIGVWFSSTTEDLQIKDYITPGRINFTAENGSTFIYDYGIKSQEVPLYRWGLNQTNIIFGNQKNNWLTSSSNGFVTRPYQSPDRTKVGQYFVSNTVVDYYDKRGYIFSKNPVNGEYSLLGANNRDKFQVGAPFHFYFGIKKGYSAFDKFAAKYLPNEEV